MSTTLVPFPSQMWVDVLRCEPQPTTELPLFVAFLSSAASALDNGMSWTPACQIAACKGNSRQAVPAMGGLDSQLLQTPQGDPC